MNCPTNCGRCCHNQSSPPFMPEEMDALPVMLRTEINGYLSGPDYDDAKPCIWLTADNRCREYNHRPEICREFRVGCEACEEMRKEAR
jgi:Fe-S-cluster containining protein